MLLSAARSGDDNPAKSAQLKLKLNVLAGYSQDEQQMIFASINFYIYSATVVGGKEVYYATLDDWKAGLQQQVAAGAAQQAVLAAQQQADAAAAASAAVVKIDAAANAAIPATTAKAATVSLTATDAPASSASIALQVLLASDQTTV